LSASTSTSNLISGPRACFLLSKPSHRNIIPLTRPILISISLFEPIKLILEGLVITLQSPIVLSQFVILPHLIVQLVHEVDFLLSQGCGFFYGFWIVAVIPVIFVVVDDVLQLLEHVGLVLS
jgi:hypothetical protein